MRKYSHRRGARALVAALVLLAVTSCGDSDEDSAGSEESPAASPSSSSSAPEPTDEATPQPDVSVVVIGDSIPYNLDTDCPGCTGFADSYGEALGKQLGKTVGVDNQSRHDGARTRDIADQLAAGELTDALGGADVVIVSIGINDQPPFPDPDQPCAAKELNTDEQAVAALAATTRACVDQVVKQTRGTARKVLSGVRSEAPDAAIAALVPYDSWQGWPPFEEAKPAVRQAGQDVVTYFFTTWRTALCAEVEKVHGTCVDLFTAFNGPDGGHAAGDLVAADNTHPSQKGNDLIRDLLLEAHLL